jgi:hypothetical protein
MNGETGGSREPADPKQARSKKEERLDKALEETFPSSDPVSVSVPPKEKDWTPEELAEAERKKRNQPPGRG